MRNYFRYVYLHVEIFLTLLLHLGLLPEAWDNFFVKYLYPSFTPTVFLFVAGTVGYGVLKYLQNEKFNSENWCFFACYIKYLGNFS